VVVWEEDSRDERRVPVVVGLLGREDVVEERWGRRP